MSVKNERQELMRRCKEGMDSDGESAFLDLVLPNDFKDFVIDLGGWTVVRGKSASYFRIYCADLLDCLRGENDG